MKDINALNKELELTNSELEEIISELVERGEFACTLDFCGLQAELI
ncbi:hypothetical protein [Acetivibrio clariflavus]|nr:hypothetical protein [Acetivibrio clariflavus]